MLLRSSKRAKTIAPPKAIPSDGDGPGSSGPSTAPKYFIPFQTGPSLERIPDDVLHEIISYLPTLDERGVEFVSVRAPTLRVLSRTSRLLRSRCLAMAWQNVTLSGAKIPKGDIVFFKAMGDTIKTCIRVLKASPHLLPLVQKVSFILTRYQADTIVSALAGCLATLPNLTTIQVIRANHQLATTIRRAFQSKQFSSVRRVSIPSCARDILQSCPNIEEVTCTDGGDQTVVHSLVKGNFPKLRALRGICSELENLAELPLNLTHIGFPMSRDKKSLARFTLLETIEIDIYYRSKADQGRPLRELVPAEIEEASKLLKANKSNSEKRVILTKWHCFGTDFELDANEEHMIRVVIRV